jgi:hypothetical protein
MRGGGSYHNLYRGLQLIYCYQNNFLIVCCMTVSVGQLELRGTLIYLEKENYLITRPEETKSLWSA